MRVVIYGIRNCDTMKKAFAWLQSHDVDYVFHDYRKHGVEPQKLAGWCREAGWETLLNRAGTTFRKLPDVDKEGLDAARAVRVMAANPSTIKRPIVEYPGGLLVGFKPDEWEAAF